MYSLNDIYSWWTSTQLPVDDETTEFITITSLNSEYFKRKSRFSENQVISTGTKHELKSKKKTWSIYQSDIDLD